MYKKKKKGSSFVVVVVIMAILFTVGTTMLTVTATDYKMRVSESNKLKNLYAADSGVDIVENVIVKTSQKAIDIAEDSVMNNIDSFNDDAEVNAEFKKEFFEVITLNGWKNVNDGRSVVSDDLIKYSIEKTAYINNLTVDEVSLTDVNVNDAEIAVTEYTKNLNATTGYIESIDIKVTSTFFNSTGELRDEKVIETTFKITAPNFKRKLEEKDVQVSIDMYPVFDGKAITADGNMAVAGVSNVKGDIWIKGNGELENNPAYAFDKYKGGISVDNGELNLTGNISTSKTLHLKTAAKAIISGDVYALNAYVGKSDKSGISTGNVFTINNGNLVVNNDLALNAKNSAISLLNFYGINDKTATNITNATNLDRAMKSSSIIVNDADGNSTLNISNETYVMGVAYIDTKDDKYQTGESVAVKGNYLAYSDVLDSYKDKVTLKYYNPLELIETIEGSVDKGKYFKDYYDVNSSSLKSGGITLNSTKVRTVGAYVNGNTANYTGWSLDGNDTVIKGKREDFAQNVFSMGDTTGALTGSLNKIDLYNTGAVVKSVANQIKFLKDDGTTSIIPNTHVFNETYGKVIFNSDATKVLTIKKDKIIIGTTEIAITGDKIDGLVISAGKVVIDGEITFNGTIISGGDVELTGSGAKTLNHDIELVKKIISSNYDVLKPVFSGTPKNGASVNVTVGQSVSFTGESSGYAVNEYVDNGIWKIKK